MGIRRQHSLERGASPSSSSTGLIHFGVVNLIFLYGPAAVGKLTVGRELAKLTGYRLFHNHLVVDTLLAVFEFGSEPFVKLREEIWLAVFREAARRRVSTIFTFTPERTVGSAFPTEAVRVVSEEGGRVRFVELTTTMAELERRVENESREAFGKLRSVELFRELERSGAFRYQGLPAPELSVDTTELPPREVASLIERDLGLK